MSGKIDVRQTSAPISTLTRTEPKPRACWPCSASISSWRRSSGRLTKCQAAGPSHSQSSALNAPACSYRGLTHSVGALRARSRCHVPEVMDRIVQQVAGERVDGEDGTVASPTTSLPLRTLDAVEARRQPSSGVDQVATHLVRVLRAVVGLDGRGVLIPVLELRIVLGEHQLEPSGRRVRTHHAHDTRTRAHSTPTARDDDEHPDPAAPGPTRWHSPGSSRRSSADPSPPCRTSNRDTAARAPTSSSSCPVRSLRHVPCPDATACQPGSRTAFPLAGSPTGATIIRVTAPFSCSAVVLGRTHDTSPAEDCHMVRRGGGERRGGGGGRGGRGGGVWEEGEPTDELTAFLTPYVET